MNHVGRKVLIGSIAASVVLGGAGYMQNKTFAASSDSSSTAVNQ